jgi:hypothetical protein
MTLIAPTVDLLESPAKSTVICYSRKMAVATRPA